MTMQPEIPRRVLIVDDNVDSASSLAMLLGIMGHTTKAANSGESALALAEEFRPEVVILDIGMPQMDGYEAARSLRALPWSDSTLLIALTGWEDARDQEKARQSGFDAHVVKPGDLQALTQLIARERVR